MTCTIFYSWQSDTPSSCNRTFIRNAIDVAIAGLPQTAEVSESPRVESGMEGVAGTPEVATVMFDKIRKSAVFIGDVTLVGSVESADERCEKRLPNPNVLLETGFAAGTMGWGRIICVMNEHFGRSQDQPFDLRNRRFPIRYSSDPGHPEGRGETKAELAKCVQLAIKTVMASRLAAAQEAVASLDINCLNLMHAHAANDRFAAPDPRATVIGGALDTARFNSAVVRLLDLRLLKAEVDPAGKLYAYHWTYLGKESLIILGIREPTQAPPASSGETS